jgi:hypothetical protein
MYGLQKAGGVKMVVAAAWGGWCSDVVVDLAIVAMPGGKTGREDMGVSLIRFAATAGTAPRIVGTFKD